MDADIIKINVLGIKESVDLSKTLLVKNILPAEISAKLSAQPYLYSRMGNIRVEIEYEISKIEDEFDRWKADKMTTVSDNEKLSDTARLRLVKKKYQKAYYDFVDKIRELKHYYSLADIARKGFKSQGFALGKQVDLIAGKRAEPNTTKVEDGTFKKVKKVKKKTGGKK